ncbi:unannotated protein [freshwater metagenome]|uniref:Unannotated protein n=1 Tax=freshwater metagenome TaxID=449393 RepID=A0A6J6ZV51_9ZZZZ
MLIDELGPLNEGLHHLGLGNDRDVDALYEEMAPLVASSDAEVRLTSLPRSVHHAAHDRDLQR